MKRHKTLRVNNGDSVAGKVALYDRTTKSSSAFVEDFAVGRALEPALVRLSDQDCWRLYRGNEWVLAAVDRIVNDCVKVKPEVRPKDKKSKISGRLAKRIKEVQDFLDNPNDNKESFADIREKNIRNLLVFGRAAIEKVLNPNRTLRELYGISSKHIKIHADQHGTLPESQAYSFTVGRQKPIYYDIDELIFVILKPTTETVYGLKPLDGIANAVAADILRETYNSKFFINGAEAAGVLGLEGMSNQELQKFRSYWKENFKGSKNAHKTAAVNVPIKYVRMAITNRDLQFSEYGKELRTKIFANYHIPPFVMGIMDESSGKSNSGQQTELYKDGALRPILEKESYYYTKEIIEMGFGYKDIELVFPSIDLVEFEVQAKTDREDCAAGIRVINEVRASRGLANVPWGDTPISVLPGGGQVDPKTGKLIPPSKQENKKPAKKDIEIYIDVVKRKLGILFENTLDKGILLTEPEVYEYLGEILDCSRFKDLESIKDKLFKAIFTSISARTHINSITEIDKILHAEKID